MKKSTTKNYYSALLILFSFFGKTIMIAQNIGINATGALPNSSAMLDIVSSTKGLLIPRVALSATNSNAPIGASIATSLLVYNTATAGVAPNNVTPGYYYWDGAAWLRVVSSSGSGGTNWLLTGNAGTNATINFIGTTDAQDFVFKTNNSERMRILNTGNVGIGSGSLIPVQKLDVLGNINIVQDSNYRINNTRVLSVKGNGNLFAGNDAGIANNAGYLNTFIGHRAGYSTTSGYENTFVGFYAGRVNTTSSYNTFLGTYAGDNNTSGESNTFLGNRCGGANTTGSYNAFVGARAGDFNTTGVRNTNVGYYAGYYNTTGNSNTYLGAYAAYQTTTADANCVIGAYAGGQNTTGAQNVFIGYDAANGNTTGSNNVFIGRLARGTTATITNGIAIGDGATVNADNKAVIGNGAITSIGGQVGWSTFSDARLKTNVKESKLGLNFILKLNPVTYNYLAKGQEGIVYTGLIAQEVESVLQQLGTEFSGLDKPKNEQDFYAIRYAEFVIPLIKAVQEQQQKIEDLEQEIKKMKSGNK